MERGKLIVVDGLDGVGKGVVERALIEFEQKLGKAVFDSISFSKAHSKGLPELSDFWSPPDIHYHTIITAEPTYAGIGKVIREELTAKNGRTYSSEDQIQAFSLDREVLEKRVSRSARENGLTDLRSRCVASTLCYQSLKAEDEEKNTEKIRERILAHDGNRYQLEWAPDLLIIPTIGDIKELMERLHKRAESQKDDNSIFENIEFQGRLKGLYESEWLKNIFENHGTKVAYLDAGISVESSRTQSVAIYRHFLDTGEVHPNHRDLPK